MNEENTNYKKLYLQMFNTITDAIEYLKNTDCDKSEIIEILIRIQQQAEESYIDGE